MGRDIADAEGGMLWPEFQSTRPAWGATPAPAAGWIKDMVSIHAPRMGRDDEHLLLEVDSVEVSIHAPRMGRDKRSIR